MFVGLCFRVVGPLRGPHCGSEMQIIAWIEQPEVIRKILRHLDPWERPQRSPPPKLFPHKLEAFMAFLSPPAGSTNPSLRRFGFLGRCPGPGTAEEPKLFTLHLIPVCLFSPLFALIPATLTLSQPQGRLCPFCSLFSPQKTCL